MVDKLATALINHEHHVAETPSCLQTTLLFKYHGPLNENIGVGQILSIAEEEGWVYLPHNR